MFAENQKELRLLVSMDDKAYLRSGTDVGARDTKAGVTLSPQQRLQLVNNRERENWGALKGSAGNDLYFSLYPVSPCFKRAVKA